MYRKKPSSALPVKSSFIYRHLPKCIHYHPGSEQEVTGSGVTALHSEWGASPLVTEHKCFFPNSEHECRSLFTSEIWPFSSFLRFGIEYTEQARQQKKTVAFSDKSASEKPASPAAPALCGRGRWICGWRGLKALIVMPEMHVWPAIFIFCSTGYKIRNNSGHYLVEMSILN